MFFQQILMLFGGLPEPGGVVIFEDNGSKMSLAARGD